MSIYSVYWLHFPEHTDVHTEGYVGVTRNPKDRFRLHRYYPKNEHIKAAVEERGDDLVFDVLFSDPDKAVCMQKENELRPKEHIGWNVSPGGGKNVQRFGRPVSEETRKLLSDKIKALGVKPSFKGHTHSLETRHRMSESRMRYLENQMSV